MPASHDGDTAEWIACRRGRQRARVVRAGLAAGAPLDPDDWAWAEAESLSWSARRPADAPADSLTLQWKSREVPVGVETVWDPDDDEHGDDPAYGLVPTSDEAWDAALGVLADRRRVPAPAGRRSGRSRCTSWCATSTSWSSRPGPDPDAVESVVLAVPVSPWCWPRSPAWRPTSTPSSPLMTAVQEALGLQD